MSGHNFSADWLSALQAGYTNIVDPGDAGTIYVTNKGYARVPLVSGSSGETRVLADPTAPGVIVQLDFKTDGGGSVVVTPSTAYDQDGNTTFTLDDAGDYIMLVAVEKGSAYVWRPLAYDGVTGPASQENIELGEGANIVVGTTTGSSFGSAVTQKVSFYGVTPVVQPAAAGQADQGAMTTTGTNTGTSAAGLSLIGATNSGDVSGAIMNDFVALQEDITALDTLVTEMRTAMVNLGLMKGSA